MTNLNQDENDQAIQALGPRRVAPGAQNVVVNIGAVANLVQLDPNTQYRVISEVRFHFAMGADNTVVATAADEMQPPDMPMVLTTDGNHDHISFIAPGGNGRLWIREWA